MSEDLANAQRRIEEERRRLAVIIESLGDGLIVTEPGSLIVATVNPRAAELVPELSVGDKADAEDSPATSLRHARATIDSGSGTQFDPRVIDAFNTIDDQVFERIATEIR